VLRRELKFKWLGLASLNRSIIHQRSRLTFLKEGGMNTKFFHLQACNRGRKSFIDRLHHKGETVVHELDKALIVFYHVDAILGLVTFCHATRLGYALRLQWEWQAKTAPDTPWPSFVTKAERAVQAMFEASVTV
jgi:hypothetical protein